MSTFYTLWRASDAARNGDLLVMTLLVLAQIGTYYLLDTKELPIPTYLAQKIYILVVVIMDLASTLLIGIRSMT